ncbi:unnamed protein product [Caenorhabditis auriculariae]|uniref:SXP/RAL-2 family protein Ani s 5-like cation-binding domain-containing protein n=1 Tax=Caenorhabditis auriculariae TaxID=2777116 RepID=A0A8S1HY49_9PELO|nr:unnamed protein product [Caenorhabditis auriculariae]
MFKASTFVAFLVFVSFASALDDEQQAVVQAMKDAALSDAAIQGLSKIGAQHEDAMKDLQAHPENSIEAIKSLNDDINDFMSSATESDRTAWKAFEAKMASNTGEVFNKAMRDAGISEPTIAELTKIGQQHAGALNSAQGNAEATKAAFEALNADIQKYIVTTSAEDQAAWKQYEQKLKTAFGIKQAN